MGGAIALVDANNFYVSCERRLTPGEGRLRTLLDRALVDLKLAEDAAR